MCFGLDADSLARYRVSARSWLSLVSSDVHGVDTMCFLPGAFIYSVDTM